MDWNKFFNDFADKYYSVPDFTNEEHVYALQNYLIEQGMVVEDVDYAIKTLLGEELPRPKNAWNERAKTQWPHMSSCNKLSDARKQIIQDYIDADSTWLEQALTAIAKLPLPMNADGRHKANVNWFLKPDMVLQINEGFGQWGKDYKPPPVKKRETPEQRQARAEASALHQMIQEHRKAGNGTSDECEALKRRLEEVEKQAK